ncbi:MAG TPA: hypothetical protein VJ728_01645 [Candidatus Binataceae bacterium]|nr:hypothetical protein [Candidatus Binataceae bacterium]
MRAADLDSRQFSLRLDDGTRIIAEFTAEQESTITEALREHTSRRMRLKAMAELARTGRIKRVASVELLTVEPAEGALPVPSSKPIWEVALELGASVPKEEWATVPTDGARNIHHYLYGAPKLNE